MLPLLQPRWRRINGNENQEMVTLGRDILKVRSSPSFYLFRNGEQVFKFTGAPAAETSRLPEVCQQKQSPLAIAICLHASHARTGKPWISHFGYMKPYMPYPSKVIRGVQQSSFTLTMQTLCL